MIDRHFKIELIITAIRFITTPVEIDPGCSQAGASDTPVKRLLLRVNTDSPGALLEDAVVQPFFDSDQGA